MLSDLHQEHRINVRLGSTCVLRRRHWFTNTVYSGSLDLPQAPPFSGLPSLSRITNRRTTERAISTSSIARLNETRGRARDAALKGDTFIDGDHIVSSAVLCFVVQLDIRSGRRGRVFITRR